MVKRGLVEVSGQWMCSLSVMDIELSTWCISQIDVAVITSGVGVLDRSVCFIILAV